MDARRWLVLLAAAMLLASPVLGAEEDAGGGDDTYDGYAYDYSYYGDYGYSDYDVAMEETCTFSEDESVLSNGVAVCDIVVSEVSELSELPGNIHGLYYASNCKNGRPVYIRHEESTPAGIAPLPTTLFYSQYFGDWEFQVPGIQFMEAEEKLKLADAIVAFAGNRTTLVPTDIKPGMMDGTWFIKTKLTKSSSLDDYIEAKDLHIECRGDNWRGNDTTDPTGHAYAMIVIFSLLAIAVVCGIPGMFIFRHQMNKIPAAAFKLLEPEKESAA